MTPKNKAKLASIELPGSRINLANTPSVVTPSSKLAPRKRSRTPERNTTTIVEIAPPRPRKKKRKESVRSSDDPSSSTTSLNPRLPTELMQTMSDPGEPSQSRTASKPRARPSCIPNKIEISYPVRSPQSHVQALEDSLSKARAEVAGLRERLATQQREAEELLQERLATQKKEHKESLQEHLATQKREAEELLSKRLAIQRKEADELLLHHTLAYDSNLEDLEKAHFDERSWQDHEHLDEMAEQKDVHAEELFDKEMELQSQRSDFEDRLKQKDQELEAQKAETERLRHEKDLELEEQSRVYEQQHKEQMLIRQNMMLDLMKANDDLGKKVSAFNREKHYLQVHADEQKSEVIELKARLETLSAKSSQIMSDLSICRRKNEHLQALNKTMEEDIDELRRIENEDAAHRKKQLLGLPPAYGSLDDEEYQPPYSLHTDGGTFDIKTLGTTTCDEFYRRLTIAQTRFDKLRVSTKIQDKTEADFTMFYMLSNALKECCHRLKAALDAAENVCSFRANELEARYTAAGTSDTETDGQRDMRESSEMCNARHEYMAGRIADLILNIGWEVVSACELRPTKLCLTAQAKAKLGLAYKETDDCLLEALRRAFIDWEEEAGTAGYAYSEKTQIVFRYQCYLTRIQALQKKFSSLGAGVSYSYFSKSMGWLVEMVEMGRFYQANSVPPASAAPVQTCPRIRESERAPMPPPPGGYTFGDIAPPVPQHLAA